MHEHIDRQVTCDFKLWDINHEYGGDTSHMYEQ